MLLKDPQQSADAASPSLPRVLVVNGSATVLDALRTLLKGSYAVLTAGDGAQALSMAAREKPDLILMDSALVGMNGFDTCATLQVQEETWDIPVILLAPSGREADGARALEVGAADFLVDPVTPDILRATLQAQVELRRSRDLMRKGAGKEPSGAQRIDPILPPPPVILLVEDDKYLRALLTLRLEFLGARVEVAPDGREALAFLDRMRPDLILSDAVMPGMDGFALCEKVKERAALRAVPFVLLTSLSRNLRERSAEAGADDYISKQEEEMVFRLRARTLLQLGIHRAAVPVSHKAPPDSVVAVVSRSGPVQSQLHVQLAQEGVMVRRLATLEEAFLDAQRKEPDVLVLDLDQEAAVYHDWLGSLRELPGCAGMPVMALMGKGEEARYRDLEGRLDDRLTKPLDAQEARHRLKILLRLSRTRVPA